MGKTESPAGNRKVDAVNKQILLTKLFGERKFSGRFYGNYSGYVCRLKYRWKYLSIDDRICHCKVV